MGPEQTVTMGPIEVDRANLPDAKQLSSQSRISQLMFLAASQVSYPGSDGQPWWHRIEQPQGCEPVPVVDGRCLRREITVSRGGVASNVLPSTRGGRCVGIGSGPGTQSGRASHLDSPLLRQVTGKSSCQVRFELHPSGPVAEYADTREPGGFDLPDVIGEFQIAGAFHRSVGSRQKFRQTDCGLHETAFR